MGTIEPLEFTTKAKVQASCRIEHEVVGFLENFGLRSYQEAFRLNGVGEMATIMNIDSAGMQSLGMLPGHQLKLEAAIESLKRSGAHSATGRFAPCPPPAESWSLNLLHQGASFRSNLTQPSNSPSYYTDADAVVLPETSPSSPFRKQPRVIFPV